MNRGSNLWEKLLGKSIINDTIIIESFGDIHPKLNGPIFTGSKLFMLGCDKNFVYYHMNKKTFPNVTTVYLASHPCEPDVFRRKFEQIYLIDDYKHYKEKWAEGLDRVKNISCDDLFMTLVS